MANFILGGSKSTEDGDCSHEIKRCLIFERTFMTNIDSIFKSRDITLPTKVHLVKAMVFPVVMYGCESRTIWKTEHQRTDAFELSCRSRLLIFPWTSRISNQCILKEYNPECSLGGLMFNLNLQYFGHLLKRPWCRERLKAGREGHNIGLIGWMASPTQRTWVWVNSGSWWSIRCCSPWDHKE